MKRLICCFVKNGWKTVHIAAHQRWSKFSEWSVAFSQHKEWNYHAGSPDNEPDDFEEQEMFQEYLSKLHLLNTVCSQLEHLLQNRFEETLEALESHSSLLPLESHFLVLSLQFLHILLKTTGWKERILWNLGNLLIWKTNTILKFLDTLSYFWSSTLKLWFCWQAMLLTKIWFGILLRKKQIHYRGIQTWPGTQSFRATIYLECLSLQSTKNAGYRRW